MDPSVGHVPPGPPQPADPSHAVLDDVWRKGHGEWWAWLEGVLWRGLLHPPQHPRRSPLEDPLSSTMDGCPEVRVNRVTPGPPGRPWWGDSSSATPSLPDRPGHVEGGGEAGRSGPHQLSSRPTGAPGPNLVHFPVCPSRCVRSPLACSKAESPTRTWSPKSRHQAPLGGSGRLVTLEA